MTCATAEEVGRHLPHLCSKKYLLVGHAVRTEISGDSDRSPNKGEVHWDLIYTVEEACGWK